jgi:hypothetical protein
MLQYQNILRAALQEERHSQKLEHLVAGLVGRLLGISVAIAKSGFQHGGDAGAAGQQGRRFRLECKKYSDGTGLSNRELLGEIDHALARDEALEAWVLVATRSVPEQLAQDLVQKGERLGVPVLIIDWKKKELVPLAALCAFDPDLVENEFSGHAAAQARALQPEMGEAISALRRSLQSWCLGFATLRLRSHLKLESIWTCKRTSCAELGQDVAGGAQPKKLRRESVHNALDTWWQGPARDDSPAAVIGLDGVGKTWAVLYWLIDRRAEQPIILTVPSSALAINTGISESAIKRLLAERLFDLDGIRDVEHWLRRLEYLLKRPKDEGPVLTVFFDGLNQEPSFAWLTLLKAIQGVLFEGRVRVILSTRLHHFETKLSSLRGLVQPAVPIVVDLYNAAAGSELDQMLDFEKITRKDLHPELVELARSPRLFSLVVKFRDRLVEAGRVTVHRLLWEYGRDTLGHRAGRSFSEPEWRAWLAEIADRYRHGIQAFSLKSLSETTSRPDLSESEIYARLSDIVDSRFAKIGGPGDIQLSETLVAHALGAALLAHLDSMSDPAFEAAESEVMQWFDPVAGLDMRAEILRASLSIFVERGDVTTTHIGGVLITAWLQTQNITDGHRLELAGLAPNITEALLYAVEKSDAPAQASARLWAVNALRAIPRTEGPQMAAIVARTRTWLSTVSRELHNELSANADFEKQRSAKYLKRVGVDKSGPLTVLGVELQFVDRDNGILQTTVPSILEGFPVAKLLPCFEVIAIALSARGQAPAWDGLRWLCYLNEVDPEPAASALRSLSAEMRARVPEADIDPNLPSRAAAALLWLSGREADEEMAAAIDRQIDRPHAYEKNYLPNPGRSFFALERRHVASVLNDSGLSIRMRLQRTRELWLDPTFLPSSDFVDELSDWAANFDVEKLHRQMGRSPEDLLFEELEPVLARCAPDLLSALVRRKLQSLASCPPESRYWCSIRAVDYLILVGEPEALAAQVLRRSARENDENYEAIVASDLLKIELRRLPNTQSHFETIIAADLKFISADMIEVVRPPTPQDVDDLITRYADQSTKQQRDLILLLSMHATPFSDSTWSWLSTHLSQPDHELRGVLFRMLTLADSARLGCILAAGQWMWKPTAHLWENHYGSEALIKSELALPFDQLAPRLAPWRLLEAAYVRGAHPAEVRLAASIFGQVLAADKMEAPELGSTLTVHRAEKKFAPFVVTVEPRLGPEEQGALMPPSGANLEGETQVNAHMRAIEKATKRMEEARKSGASLYLTDVEVIHLEPVVRYAPDVIDRWLDGCSDVTTDFRRRVRLAETAFLALCEALLVHEPERGRTLWRALRVTVTTRYLGEAGIDEFLHIVFRAPDSAQVFALREEVLSLPLCRTDLDLFNVATAAVYNGKSDWLEETASADQASPLVWRQRRGTLLSSLSTGYRLPVTEAWPEGEICTGTADLRHKAAVLRWRDACAHHWWKTYQEASDAVTAYAAWIMFLRSADARASTWIGNVGYELHMDGDFSALKFAHFKLNLPELKRAMQNPLDEFDRRFLYFNTVYGVGPWGKATNTS